GGAVRGEGSRQPPLRTEKTRIYISTAGTGRPFPKRRPAGGPALLRSTTCLGFGSPFQDTGTEYLQAAPRKCPEMRNMKPSCLTHPRGEKPSRPTRQALGPQQLPLRKSTIHLTPATRLGSRA